MHPINLPKKIPLTSQDFTPNSINPLSPTGSPSLCPTPRHKMLQPWCAWQTWMRQGQTAQPKSLGNHKRTRREREIRIYRYVNYIYIHTVDKILYKYDIYILYGSTIYTYTQYIYIYLIYTYIFTIYIYYIYTKYMIYNFGVYIYIHVYYIYLYYIW